MSVLVKTTLDGRRLEAKGSALYLDGELEARELIEVRVHPNAAAILKAIPQATHVAGRLPLTATEAAAAQAALDAGDSAQLASPAGASERMRCVVNSMLRVRSED